MKTKKKIIISLISLISVFLLLYGYSRIRTMGGMMKGMMDTSMERHRFVMHNGVDEKYDSLTNPLPTSGSNIKEGKQLYEVNCASCHGLSGKGDGEAAKNLNPTPANITGISKRHIATDSYLFWTIAEGGVPLESAMPSFKTILKEDEIWKIVIYLHKL